MNIFYHLAILFTALSSLSVQFANAGVDSSGGGGILARHLITAQEHLQQQLPYLASEIVFKDQVELQRLYKKIENRIQEDLKSIRFVPVPESQILRDQHFGYTTWIRILSGSPITIEYDPSVESYQRIVESVLSGKSAPSAPRLSDVEGFLLHELGHHYGLDEEMAWKFARGLQKAIQEGIDVTFNGPVTCEIPELGEKINLSLTSYGALNFCEHRYGFPCSNVTVLHGDNVGGKWFTDYQVGWLPDNREKYPEKTIILAERFSLSGEPILDFTLLFFAPGPAAQLEKLGRALWENSVSRKHFPSPFQRNRLSDITISARDLYDNEGVVERGVALLNVKKASVELKTLRCKADQLRLLKRTAVF